MSAPRPGDLLGGRYVLLDVLGEGSSSTVLRARDRWQQSDVAVKVFRGGDRGSRADAARREHQLGRDLGHPAIASVIDAGTFGEHPFVVMELAAGDPLDHALRGADSRHVAQVIDTIASALGALHARGLVHADLKPANVRVARRDRRLAARLLDLGCARAPGTIGGGTAAYAAPEALSGAATIASDLFSLGVVAWEALTGALPFGSPDADGFVARLAEGRLEEPHGALTPELASVLRRALAADPAARPRSAGELRAALRAAVELGAIEEAPAAPLFVGRDAALDAMRTHARDVAAQAARGPLWIEGAPRSGRTRLIALGATDARIEGAVTIETSARGDLAEWLHALVALAERAGASGADAARAAIDTPTGHAEGRHARLFAVLDVLASAAAGAPLLVIVDDGDRASPAVRDALAFLSSARSVARLGWVIVDRAPDDAAAVRLGALDEAATTALIASLVPGLDAAPELAHLARSRTSGMPGEIVDGTLALVHAGAIRCVHGQWRRNAEGLPRWAYQELDGSRIDAQIARLGSDARATLAASALDGAPIETAAARLGIAPDAVQRAIGSAARAGLARRNGAEHELASPEVRTRLIAPLDEDTRRALHERAIASLAAATDSASLAARAQHLAAIGDTPEAARDALEAARARASGGDLQGAAQLFEQARAWGDAEQAGPAALALGGIRAALGEIDAGLAALDHARRSGVTASVVARARGAVLARAARYDLAIDALTELRATSALDPGDRFWLGWSLMMRGRYDEAEALIEPSPVDAGERARLGRLAGTIAWHRGRFDDACSILERARADARASGDVLLVAEVEQSLGTAERLRGRLVEAAARYGAAIDAARRGGHASLLAKALNNLAIVEYQSGRWERARLAWESMQELAVRLRATEEILLAHNNLGLLFQDRGELERAERSLDEAIRIARGHDLVRYEAMALGNRAEVRARAGRWDAASADLDGSEAIAERIGARDELLECGRRRAMIRLGRGHAAGALPAAVAVAERAAAAGATSESGHAWLIAAQAARALGRVEDAECHLAAVAAAWGEGATRLDAARLELERARVRLAAGDRREAVRLARRAGESFAELGAPIELAEVRAIEDADLAADRGEALLGILRVAGDAADAATLLDTVLGRIVALTGADRGVVITFAGDEEPRVAASRGAEGADRLVWSRGIADRAIASRRALVLANVDDESELAGRESVVRLGVRAALCAPLMQDDACLGLLYVDSTRGPELVRFGLWVVDAAAAILAPALARLAERDRREEREALLRAIAIDAIETVGAVDSALDLVADGVTRAEDAARLTVVRDRMGALISRSERMLEMVRVEGDRQRPIADTFTVRTLIASALEALEGSLAPDVELQGGGALVRGDLQPLASAITRMIESAARGAGVTPTVRARETGPTHDPLVDRGRWRPGASAGRRFVRIEVEGAPRDAFGTAPDALALRTARRLAARNGGRLFVEPGARGERLVMEIEAMEATS